MRAIKRQLKHFKNVNYDSAHGNMSGARLGLIYGGIFIDKYRNLFIISLYRLGDAKYDSSRIGQRQQLLGDNSDGHPIVCNDRL